MAALQFPNIAPRDRISEKTSPAAIRKALHEIFSGIDEGLWLVGGTALAGYYAEHRRSDDLDLFAIDEMTFQMATGAVRSLAKKGASLSGERKSHTFFHVDALFQGHPFTIDVVLDENLHRVGTAHRTEEGVLVANLPTLFGSKVACLINRCSEKDLFDLDWIFERLGKIDVPQMVQAGNEFDAGLSTETLLIGLQGARLRKEACGFLLPGSGVTIDQAFDRINSLRKRLIEAVLEFEKKQPLSGGLKQLSRAVKQERRRS